MKVQELRKLLSEAAKELVEGEERKLKAAKSPMIPIQNFIFRRRSTICVV